MEIIGKIELVGPERTFPSKNESGYEEMVQAQDFKVINGRNVFMASAVGKILNDVKKELATNATLYVCDLTFTVRERETQNHDKFYVQNVTLANLKSLI